MNEDPTRDEGIRRRTVLKTTAGLAGIGVAATEVEAHTINRSETKYFSSSNATRYFQFTDLPPASTDLDVSVEVKGDYGYAGGEYADVYADGTHLGRVAEDSSGGTIDCSTWSNTFTVSGVSRTAY